MIKRVNFIKQILWLILLMPVMAFAHSGRIPGGLILGIIVIWPAIFSAIHCLIVLLIRWKSLFRYPSFVMISKIITFFTSLLLAVSAFMYTITLGDTVMGGNDYYSQHPWELLALLFVILANLWMIMWAFKTPRKQYQLLFKKDDTTSSINEALGIKDNKG